MRFMHKTSIVNEDVAFPYKVGSIIMNYVCTMNASSLPERVACLPALGHCTRLVNDCMQTVVDKLAEALHLEVIRLPPRLSDNGGPENAPTFPDMFCDPAVPDDLIQMTDKCFNTKDNRFMGVS